MPYSWDDGYGARLGVLRRDDPCGEVRWFAVDPMRYPQMWRRDADGGTREERAVLWKWTIDPAAGTVREEQCDDRPGEFPRVDDRLTGRAAGHGHMTSGTSLVRYDLSSGAVTAHDFGPGRTPGEAAFVPADDRA